MKQLLLIILLSSLSYADNTVYGRVSDADNSSVQGVKVEISKLLCGGTEKIITAETGVDGMYFAGGLPVGWILVNPYKVGNIFIPDNSTIKIE